MTCDLEWRVYYRIVCGPGLSTAFSLVSPRPSRREVSGLLLFRGCSAVCTPARFLLSTESTYVAVSEHACCRPEGQANMVDKAIDGQTGGTARHGTGTVRAWPV